MTAAITHHIDPKEEFHPLVLLPGDPARAMAIATAQLEEPRMFSHRRGLWGYSGRTAAGTGITVQSTGMGGPSAAIVCEELVMLGARTLLRVGTCGAIDPSISLGDVVVVEAALCEDGTSRSLGTGDEVAADGDLVSTLWAEAGEAVRERGLHRGKVASVDMFYDPAAAENQQRYLGSSAIAIEMEAATVLTVAERHGIASACVLGVTDELWGDGRKRMDHDAIVELGDLLGLIAVRAVEALS